MFKGLQIALIVLILTALAGCSGSTKELRLDSGIELTVQFIDAGWDGQAIPVTGRCGDCGGGQGNEYVAKVMADRRDGDDVAVLAQKEVPLGIF